jgi:FkbM family methyltransferase
MAGSAVDDQIGPRGAGVGAVTWRARAYIVRVHVKDAWHHPANTGHRPRAVLRVLRFYARGYLLNRRTLTPIGDRSKLWADTTMTSTARVVVGNPPDWSAIQAWKNLLGPSTLFLDIGANAGTYSLCAAEQGAMVVAVEPDDDARAKLLENAALNGVTLEVHSVALADAPGTMRFSRDLGTMNHLLEDDAVHGIDVIVSTVDAILGDRRADGVKIDVEGAERLVLLGASRAMAEGRLPVIQLEWNGMAEANIGEDRGELAELLDSYGYRLFRPDAHGSFQPFDGSSTSIEDVFAVLDRS